MWREQYDPAHLGESVRVAFVYNWYLPMQKSDLPNSMEQLPDGEVLACTIFRMLVEEADDCLLGVHGDHVVSIAEISLMLCDVLRSTRLGVPVTPATRNTMNCITADLAIYRASNRV